MTYKENSDFSDAIECLDNAAMNINTVIENPSLVPILKGVQEQISSATRIIQDLRGEYKMIEIEVTCSITYEKITINICHILNYVKSKYTGATVISCVGVVQGVSVIESCEEVKALIKKAKQEDKVPATISAMILTSLKELIEESRNEVPTED